MVAAIGFDLGETLVTYAGTPLNWTALYEPALLRVASRGNFSLSQKELSAAKSILSNYNTRLRPRREDVTAAQIFREVFVAWSRPGGETASAVEVFFDFFQQRLQVYPETGVTLDELRRSGIKVGVLTDVPYGMPMEMVDRELAVSGLRSKIDVVLSSTEVGFRKPSPEGFIELASRLGVAASELWYVGNEEKDIAGPRALGATAVLIDRENKKPDWGQHYTIPDLSALPILLRN